MRILEVCNFSAGICGVWQRVKQESLELAKRGHEVYVFSSNITKGTGQIAKTEEKLGKILIKRFDVKKIAGESYMSWDNKKMQKEIFGLKPEIIIAHSYRHTHTEIISRLSKKINAKSFLVTHAPFNQDNRGLFAKLYISLFHDPFIGSKTLKRFDKIIAITKWELPYLYKLGVPKEKIVYIPNGIPEEFFKQKIKRYNARKIIFLGRIAPVKNIEILIKAFNRLDNDNLILEIIGPIEKGYENIEQYEKENIKFLLPIYDLKKKISKLNEADIFVLPSTREAMPQSLIEAMSLGKIVISSETKGGKEIIDNNKNGLLFKIGKEQELAEKILWCLDKRNKAKIRHIQKNAREKASEFKWNKLIKKLETLF